MPSTDEQRDGCAKVIPFPERDWRDDFEWNEDRTFGTRIVERSPDGSWRVREVVRAPFFVRRREVMMTEQELDELVNPRNKVFRERLRAQTNDAYRRCFGRAAPLVLIVWALSLLAIR